MTTERDKPDPHRWFFTQRRVCRAIAISSGAITAQYLFGHTPITWPQAVLFFIAGCSSHSGSTTSSSPGTDAGSPCQSDRRPDRRPMAEPDQPPAGLRFHSRTR